MRRAALLMLFAPFAVAAAPFGLAPAPAVAQEAHTVTGPELDALVAEKTAAADADREAIRSLLRHPEVRRVAKSVGLDLRRAESAVDLLDPNEVRRLAPRVRELDEALVGGKDVIVISTTTLIIALLILIIILVA